MVVYIMNALAAIASFLITADKTYPCLNFGSELESEETPSTMDKRQRFNDPALREMIR